MTEPGNDKRTELLQEEKLGALATLDEGEHVKNNLPDIVTRWKNRAAEADCPRTAQSFLVPKSELAANGNDLSINRYREVEYEELQTESPKEILAKLKGLEDEIQKGIEELEAMLA